MAAVLILGIASAALAQSALESCKDQIFQHADVNSDGMLSPKEAAAQPLNLDQRFFGFADKDQDGALDRREYENALAFVSCELCPAIPDCDAQSASTG